MALKRKAQTDLKDDLIRQHLDDLEKALDEIEKDWCRSDLWEEYFRDGKRGQYGVVLDDKTWTITPVVFCGVGHGYESREHFTFGGFDTRLIDDDEFMDEWWGQDTENPKVMPFVEDDNYHYDVRGEIAGPCRVFEASDDESEDDSEDDSEKEPRLKLTWSEWNDAKKGVETKTYDDYRDHFYHDYGKYPPTNDLVHAILEEVGDIDNMIAAVSFSDEHAHGIAIFDPDLVNLLGGRWSYDVAPWGGPIKISKQTKKDVIEQFENDIYEENWIRKYKIHLRYVCHLFDVTKAEFEKNKRARARMYYYSCDDVLGKRLHETIMRFVKILYSFYTDYVVPQMVCRLFLTPKQKLIKALDTAKMGSFAKKWGKSQTIHANKSQTVVEEKRLELQKKHETYLKEY